MNFWKKIKNIWHKWNEYNNQVYLDVLEKEVSELENIFDLLTIGVIIGLPSPPAHISLELLPLMEKEIDKMFNKVAISTDPLGELFSMFDID